MKITVGNSDPREIEVSIPEDTKKIAVLLSGGADSAILLYILAQEAKQQNVELMTFTVPRPDGAILYSPGIVDYLNSVTDLNIPHPIEVGDPSVHHSMQTRSGHSEIFRKYDVDYVFYGSQSIPEELTGLDLVYPKRPARKTFPHTICPFFDLTKEHTLDLYFKLGMTELLKYSHSCTEMQVGRCGACYNCLERAWAFTKLGYTDPGSK